MGQISAAQDKDFLLLYFLVVSPIGKSGADTNREDIQLLAVGHIVVNVRMV